MIPVKIICACGQKYAFDVEPVGCKMPMPVFCPACGCEGTRDAEQFIAKIINAKTQPLPPRAVSTRLNSATLPPHFAQALKSAVVQELAAQRRELLAAQHAAAAELTGLARRLEQIQTPLLDRLRAYEQRISDLEKELGEQSKENRELLKMKIDLLRDQIEKERVVSSRINFN
jgi:isopentenyl diphosphate isomerase/L-lactate dehydrogenase-like FMN-dependent dehydrogenase